ncbi:hypothetical protein JNB91_07240 [Rhizobium wenxiniae]|uniref:hypothetical protein n=1 Tax=Rhizobium wenxiniae TaxID=1737357 RepID=UPI001C6F52E9|nr:hypothetical protein [Rhizobium wenxiniae]MBW9087635.1 hypothetical protein [Rhizobium wenxiniae]
MRSNSLNHFKSIFAFNFFVKPADNNYYLARWTRINGLSEDFFWQCQQALEKYLKASLIVNDVPAKKQKHDLSLLYETHVDTFGSLALENFEKPDRLPIERWRKESVPAFIRRINSCGAPDSRYGLVSWYCFSDDLFKLDQLVFSLRRLSIGLDWIVGDDWVAPERLLPWKGQSFRAALEQEANIQIRSAIEVPETPSNVAGERVSDALYSWNFAWARSDRDLERLAPISLSAPFGPMRNSYLYLLWEYLQSPSSWDDPYVSDGVEWLIKNVSVGKDTANALESCLK